MGLHFSTVLTLVVLICFPAAEVTLSSLTLASRTATTLSVTWSAGYPKCYSFTVSHSIQDGSINVTQPADSDTSHTLTSLQPGTTYRIEVEAVRKEDRADRQRAKLVESFITECMWEMFVTEPVRFCQSGNLLSLCTTSNAPNFIHNCGCSFWNFLNTYWYSSSTEAYCLFRDSWWANPMHLHRSSFSCHLHHCNAFLCVLHSITCINKCTLNVLSKSCPSIHCYLQKPVTMETIPQATYVHSTYPQQTVELIICYTYTNTNILVCTIVW